MIFYEFAEATFAVQDAFGRAENIVAVGKEAGVVGGRVRWDVEDVPNVRGEGEGGPLEG